MKLWIARDEENDLCLFKNKPFYDDIGEFWYDIEEDYFDIDSSNFPEVTFENSPQLIEIEISLLNQLSNR